MAVKEGTAPIIIRRNRKRPHNAHHGGMWKIAYADFVTAMMAFFLLMWLLTVSAEADLKGIATYFQTPLKMTVSTGQVAGDPTSILRSGGIDITRSAGSVRGGDPDFDRRERNQLQALKSRLEAMVEKDATLKQFKNQILIDITDDGLRVQIVDAQNRPMFDSGKSELKDYSRIIIGELGRALNGIDNRVAISGHTDSTPFAGQVGGYSNWELSSERANAARRAMVAVGMDPSRAVRVVGVADSVPFTEGDTSSPQNRRISIVVLNKRSEELLKKGRVVADVPPVAETLNLEGSTWRAPSQEGTR